MFRRLVLSRAPAHKDKTSHVKSGREAQQARLESFLRRHGLKDIYEPQTPEGCWLFRSSLIDFPSSRHRVPRRDALPIAPRGEGEELEPCAMAAISGLGLNEQRPSKVDSGLDSRCHLRKCVKLSVRLRHRRSETSRSIQNT